VEDEKVPPVALQFTPRLEESFVTVAITLSVCPTVSPPRFGETLTAMLEPLGTVSKVVPETLPKVADIVVVPEATAVAKPDELMVAAAVLEEIHLTLLVRFCVLLSE
jgi:hypothetical protein